ncbi:MAG: type III pantothenate kinase [Salinisphaera sp.]|nr:type III pantothenate kinase [Salinisphaera sp.]
MNLLIDLGNSRLKWACVDPESEGGRLRPGGSIAYHDGGDAWWESLPRQRPHAVWFASVAGADAVAALRGFCREHWRLDPRQVHATAASCGVRNAYPRPQALGADRWLACIAAYHRGAGSVLVADAGTALTLDLVGAHGVHRGGLICPGVGTMRAGLRANTDLRMEPVAADATALAKDSPAAIASGTLQMALEVIQAARRRHRPQRVLLAGGEAAMLLPHLGAAWDHAPDLVLEGLALVAAEGA